jgi:hypothetical protein
LCARAHGVWCVSRCRNEEAIPRSLIKEADGSEGACYQFSPVLVGDFGPSSISFTASAEPWVNKTRLGLDSVYMAGDTITLELDDDTNMGGFSTDSVLDTTGVNSFLSFSRSIGASYTGQWLSRRIFKITVRSVSGAQQPLPDFLVISFKTSADVRNFPPQSAPMGASQVARLLGDFGPSVVSVVKLVANDPTDRDSIYANQDTITITFNRDTNRGHDLPSSGISKAQIDRLFFFSQSLGTDYTARWDSARQLTITVVDDTDAFPPWIGFFWVGVNPEGNLRNSPAACAPANASFPHILLEGDFGPSNIFIIDFFAEDPDNLDNEFSAGDYFLVTFSAKTNYGGLPPEAPLDKERLDRLFTFKHPMGANYTGEWRNNGSAVYIYTWDATGGSPLIDVSTVTVKASGNVRNWPPACKPSTATSPSLRGDLGRTIPYITKIVAEDPFDRDQVSARAMRSMCAVPVIVCWRVAAEGCAACSFRLVTGRVLSDLPGVRIS